jgi:hypothetical protein
MTVDFCVARRDSYISFRACKLNAISSDYHVLVRQYDWGNPSAKTAALRMTITDSGERDVCGSSRDVRIGWLRKSLNTSPARL